MAPSPDKARLVESWVEEYGDQLYRYALLRVRNGPAAEDLVQEAFVAALKSADSFRGDSSARTWLTGILKHKIMDYFRDLAKSASNGTGPDDSGSFGGAFDETRHWKVPPKAWPRTPDKEADLSALREALGKCLDGLPERQRRIFILRETDGIDTGELCKVFGLTPTNLWVILHRIRHQLKNCLERNWIG